LLATQHGAGNSPIVCGDKVIFADDQDKTATLLAFDSKTGKPAWQASRKGFRNCYSTPFLLEKKGGAPDLIVASTAGVSSYNPDTGAENWAWTWVFAGKALRNVGSPVSSQGLIFAASGDGDGSRHAVAVRIDGKDHKPELAWENK